MARAIVICTLLLIAFAGVLEASHFRYGTITWTKNATNPRAVTFNVNMGMRRSYYGAPNVGSTISDPQFCYGDGQCVIPTWTVNNVDLGLDLIYMSWTATKVYNGAGNFNAICSSCCRISTLRNNADGNYQFTSLVKLTAGEISGSTPINNSPVTAGLPIVPVQYGVVPFTYQIPSSDIDGDSRTFRMATSAELGGGVHPTGLTVSSSGLVTISSVLATGYWCTQQVIEDSFGNRVTVDYMLDVQPPKSYCNSTGGCSTPCQSAADCAACGGAASSCLNAKPRFVVRDLSSTVSPRTNRPTPAQNAVFTTLPGNPLTFYFTADDENLYKTATPVNIQFASLPTRAVRSAQVACTAANGCTYVGPYADPQTVTLTYSPIAADTGSHVICASAQSMANYLPYSQHCFTVVVANITDVCGDGIIGVTEACDGGVCCSADCKSFRAPGTQCGAPSGSCGNVPQCTGSSATCPAQGSMAPAGTICRASTGACDPAEFCTGSSPVCPSDSLSSGVCRASQGPCDQPEVCDGVSVDCPTDSFSSGSICRGANGACDVAETCDGSSAACPADSFATGGVCRAANGDCDVAEVCSGSSAACPADSFAASSVVCRASNGDCDVADTCTGSSAACPADGFAASSVVCRASAGDCDVAESCTGSSASCPSDAFSAGNTCRASAGPCDVEEICDGVGASCPTDAFNTGFTCRSSAGPCDVAETCDGSSAACPSDAVAASTVTCRGAAGICDVDEVCDGVSVDCPVDAFVGAWMTQCRASAGNCDVEEWCDGTQADCPVDGFLSSNVTCRASVSTCDKAETCTGSTASCPTDAFAPTTTLCRAPVNSCDIPEYCTSLNSVCPVNAVNQSAACSTPKDYCTRNAGVGTPGNINYFCAGTTHYTQCVAGTGNFAAKSPCPSGTGCWCAEGVDCSFGGTTSPCTIQQTSTGSE